MRSSSSPLNAQHHTQSPGWANPPPTTRPPAAPTCSLQPMPKAPPSSLSRILPWSSPQPPSSPAALSHTLLHATAPTRLTRHPHQPACRCPGKGAFPCSVPPSGHPRVLSMADSVIFDWITKPDSVTIPPCCASFLHTDLFKTLQSCS